MRNEEFTALPDKRPSLHKRLIYLCFAVTKRGLNGSTLKTNWHWETAVFVVCSRRVHFYFDL